MTFEKGYERVLITGHKGFVGGAFWKEFQRRGCSQLHGIDIQEGWDCRDFFRQNRIVPKFDLVIHCAAVVGGRAMIEYDPMAVAVDLSIDAELFNWCLSTRQTCPIVYFSSSAVYPIELQSTVRQAVLEEGMVNLEDIEMPDQTYGFAKLAGEVQAKIAREQYGLNVFVFRPFSGYGERQGLEYPFGSFIKRAVEQQDPFEIWGSGEQVRDWIHIDDIVGAVFAALDAGEQGPANLCSGEGTTFKELARQVCEQAKYEPEFQCLRNKPQGVFYRVGNPTRMKQFYRCKISLAVGIQRAILYQGVRR